MNLQEAREFGVAGWPAQWRGGKPSPRRSPTCRRRPRYRWHRARAPMALSCARVARSAAMPADSISTPRRNSITLRMSPSDCKLSGSMRNGARCWLGRDEGAHALVRGHQPLGAQRRHRFAHHRAADARGARQRLLGGHARAGREGGRYGSARRAARTARATAYGREREGEGARLDASRSGCMMTDESYQRRIPCRSAFPLAPRWRPPCLVSFRAARRGAAEASPEGHRRPPARLPDGRGDPCAWAQSSRKPPTASTRSRGTRRCSWGGEKEMTEQAQVGALQIARISVGPIGTIVDEFNVFNMPFVFRDEAQMRKVIDGRSAPKCSTSSPTARRAWWTWLDGRRHAQRLLRQAGDQARRPEGHEDPHDGKSACSSRP